MAISLDGDYKNYLQEIYKINGEIDEDLGKYDEKQKLSRLYYDKKVCELLLEENKDKVENNPLKDISNIIKCIILLFLVWGGGKSLYMEYQATSNNERLLRDVIILAAFFFLIVGLFHVVQNFIERFYSASVRRIKLKSLVVENKIKEFENDELYNKKLDKLVLEKNHIKNKEIKK